MLTMLRSGAIIKRPEPAQQRRNGPNRNRPLSKVRTRLISNCNRRLKFLAVNDGLNRLNDASSADAVRWAGAAEFRGAREMPGEGCEAIATMQVSVAETKRPTETTDRRQTTRLRHDPDVFGGARVRRR